jgi:hypothetical protein
VAKRFTARHWDEFDRTGRWSLVRRSLGVSSFGMNLVELDPDGKVPEHDAPAGTFARLDPQPSRTVVNKGRTKARVLIVSAPMSSGYDPPDWA